MLGTHVNPSLYFVIGTNIREQTVLPEMDNEGSTILELEANLNKRTRQVHS